MKVNKLIFREYDVRGVVDKDLTDETVYLLGRAFARFLNKRGLKTVAIGGDARISTPRFKDRFSQGLIDSGCQVHDVGILATPTLYFSIQHLKVDAGVMITGSHNPPEFNGFKMNVGLGSIYGKDIQEIYESIVNEDFVDGKGKVKVVEGMVKIYQDYIVDNIDLARPVKVVIDAGNGVGGPILPDILRRVGCEVTELYCDMDGNFPNHHPDPTVVEYMQDLIKTVWDSKSELGIGLDGDADRLGVIDENGKMLFGDQVLNIFAREFLENYPGEKVIADVKCSKNLFDDIKEQGGVPIMYKTGHSLIKKKMKEDNIKFGGEMSGHVFFYDRYFGYDDAIYAACRFAEIVSKSKARVSQMLTGQPKMFNTPEIRVDCPDEKKFTLVENIKKQLIREGFEVNDIDGVRVTFPDGWGLVRASNTQPVLVMRFEAQTEKRLKEIRDLVENTMFLF